MTNISCALPDERIVYGLFCGVFLIIVKTPQDLLGKIRGLEAACTCLDRERGEACLLVEGLREDLEGANTTAADMERENQRKSREVEEVGLMFSLLILLFLC